MWLNPRPATRVDNEIVQAGFERGLRLLAFLMPILLFGKGSQVTIEDTGSTNRAGLRVTFDREGHAAVQQRGGEPHDVKLSERECKQFMSDLEALGPLSALPAHHCMKSVSFGSSLFVEFNGERSPDLSCPGQDSRTEALRKHANEILQEAREAAGIKPGRIPARVPNPPR